MIERKEYHVGEIFRHDDKTFQCVRTDKSEDVRCLNCEASYLMCVASMCHGKERSDKRNVRFIRVTEPKEHMLFRASDGAMYVLKDKSGMNEYTKLGCMCFDSPGLVCYNIFREAFGKNFYSTLHWFPAEEKKAQHKKKGEENKVESQKRHIELAVDNAEGDLVTFRITEQTHRCEDFTPNGCGFRSRSGYTMVSMSCPEFKKATCKLYVRGMNSGADNYQVTVSLSHFAKIMEAVTEYNETDGKGYEDTWPKYGDTYFCFDSSGKIDVFSYDSSPFDKNRSAFGNFFRTREEAEAALERVKKVL